jgi:hypothetical protein
MPMMRITLAQDDAERERELPTPFLGVGKTADEGKWNV